MRALSENKISKSPSSKCKENALLND